MRGASFAVLCFRIAKCVWWSYKRRIFHCTVFQNCEMCKVVLWEAHLLLYCVSELPDMLGGLMRGAYFTVLCFRIARCVRWSYDRHIFHCTVFQNCKSNCEVNCEKQHSDAPCGSPITRIMCRWKLLYMCGDVSGRPGQIKTFTLEFPRLLSKRSLLNFALWYQFPALIDLDEGQT